MKILTLKYYSLLFILLSMLSLSCSEMDEETSINNLLVVTDATGSVKYSSNPNQIKYLLRDAYDKCFSDDNHLTDYKLWTIGENNQSITPSDRFEELYPEGDPTRSSVKTSIELWNSRRKTWVMQQIDNIANKISIGGNGKATNIFSLIYTIETEKNKLGPNETMQIVVFSDMVHEMPTRNQTEANNRTAEKAKADFREDINSNKVSKHNNGKVQIVLVFPIISKYKVKEYWKTYLSEWGLENNTVEL